MCSGTPCARASRSRPRGPEIPPIPRPGSSRSTLAGSQMVGSVMPERTAFQSHISSLAAEALGIKPSALSARTEHMCASGTVGIPLRLRVHRRRPWPIFVMVLGVEKLNQPSGDEAILNMAPASTVSGSRLRPHRAALLRAGRPAPHDRLRTTEEHSPRRRENPPTPARTPTRTSTRAPRWTRCSARG